MLLPPEGVLLRETSAGWSDEQHSGFRPTSADLPLRADPVIALLLDAGGLRLGGRRRDRR